MKATGRQRAGARDKRETPAGARAPKATTRSVRPRNQVPAPPDEPDVATANEPPGTPGMIGERRPRREAAVPADAALTAIAAAAPSAVTKAARAPAKAAWLALGAEPSARPAG
jgi:hypothetical protein